MFQGLKKFECDFLFENITFQVTVDPSQKNLSFKATCFAGSVLLSLLCVYYFCTIFDATKKLAAVSPFSLTAYLVFTIRNTWAACNLDNFEGSH
jgi:hypothetical protein